MKERNMAERKINGRDEQRISPVFSIFLSAIFLSFKIHDTRLHFAGIVPGSSLSVRHCTTRKEGTRDPSLPAEVDAGYEGMMSDIMAQATEYQYGPAISSTRRYCVAA